MDEVEYVVPPESGSPKISNKVVKPPKKPNQALEWVKSHKFLSGAGLVMACIIVLFGGAMITGQSLSIGGLQLNPLVNKAACPIGTESPCVGEALEFVSPLPKGVVNQPYSQNLLVTSTTQSCTWALISISPAISGAAITDGVFTATPTAVGTYQITFKVFCGDGQKAMPTIPWSVTLTPESPASIEGSFAPGKVGQLYSQEFTLAGTAAAPCTWAVGSILPALTDATFLSNDGPGTTATFRATPTVVADYKVTIKVSCQNNQVLSKVLTWPVEDASAQDLSISGTWPEAAVNVPFTTTMVLEGSPKIPCTWKIGSSLPLIKTATITPRTDGTAAVYSTTPEATGDYKVTILVTCQGGQSATKEFKLTVKSATGGSTFNVKGSFSNGKVGQAYTANVTTDGAKTSDCQWTLGGVKPAVSGATLTRVDNIVAGTESSAMFSATPQTARDYVVAVSASCMFSSDATKAPVKIVVEKQFDWKVTANTTTGGGNTGGGGGSTANACTTSSLADKLTPIYRFWKDGDKDHFFTTNANEKPAGYTYEGIAGYVFKEKVAGSTAVYRSYSPSLTAHYYSTTDDATNYGYNNEGILGYAYSDAKTGSSSWFRLHRGWPSSDYLETISSPEKIAAMAMGYADEGIVANICGPDHPQ